MPSVGTLIAGVALGLLVGVPIIGSLAGGLGLGNIVGSLTSGSGAKTNPPGDWRAPGQTFDASWSSRGRTILS